MHSVARRVGHHHRLGVKTAEAPGGLFAEIARSHDHHTFVAQIVGLHHVPSTGALGVQEIRQPTLGSQDQQENHFGHRTAVHAAGVTKGDAVGDPADHVLDARAGQLHDLQGRHGREHPGKVARIFHLRYPEARLCQVWGLLTFAVPGDYLHPIGHRAQQFDGLLIRYAHDSHVRHRR